jgi:hypothetical protein
MAKKKEVKKDSKKAVKSKSITSALTKSVSKLTQKVVAAVSKTAKKAPKEEKLKKVEKIVKPAAKVAVKVTAKPVAKPVPKSIEKKSKVLAEEIEENTGDTLIEMAKAEMAAVKIGQTAEKAEKASKFKAIKVERGNLADEKAKWQELNKRHGKDKAETYKMTATFEALKPIQHKVLGWGFVLTNENDRLEVLFENGIKMLISNYKPN